VSPDNVVVIVLASLLAWTVTRVFRGPLGDALARRIGGDAGPRPTEDPELAERRTRVAELEERQDFTERVLLQDRPAGELPRRGE
jgi:hypothetical protein